MSIEWRYSVTVRVKLNYRFNLLGTSWYRIRIQYMADVNYTSPAFNNTHKIPSHNIYKEIIKPWIRIRVIIFQTLISKMLQMVWAKIAVRNKC